MPVMRFAAGLVVCTLALASTVLAQEPDPITRARVLYNQRDFDASIAAADAARSNPAMADLADLVAARAYLERYRQTADEADLVNARTLLRRINPQRFDPRQRAEYIVGLGTALYFEDLPGAAAAAFAPLLDTANALDPAEREKLLDWWASAIDRDARPQPAVERKAMYETIRERMRRELGTNPSSSVAAYWMAAAAAGAGDWQTAWEDALAAWVRAPLTVDQGAVLLADIDRLVQRAIAPERARTLDQPVEPALQEWTAFKERWTR